MNYKPMISMLCNFGLNNYFRNDYGSPFLPLTQRLVCALIEENIMSAVGDNNIPDSG